MNAERIRKIQAETVVPHSLSVQQALFKVWHEAENDCVRAKVDALEAAHITTTEQPGGSCPSQYALPDNAFDLQDLIEFRKMNFAEGNIFKAIYRKGACSHSDRLRDMRKIRWFADREIARLAKEETK